MYTQVKKKKRFTNMHLPTKCTWNISAPQQQRDRGGQTLGKTIDYTQTRDFSIIYNLLYEGL